MEENLINNTQSFSRIQLYYFKSELKWKHKQQSLTCFVAPAAFLVATPEIHCFAVSSKPSQLIEEEIEETDAWSPVVLLTYPNCLNNIDAVHPFTSHMPLRNNRDILDAIHSNSSPSYEFWSLSVKLFLGII